jgi:RHS repeat-associated protein
VTYNYDYNFNLREAPNWWGVFDAESRLTMAGGGGSVASFTYDGLGRCVRRIVYPPGGGSNTVIYVYDGWKPVLEFDAAGNYRASNVYGAGADEILFRWDTTYGGSIYKQDRHGNIVAVLDQWGNIAERYSYDSFGKAKIMSWWDNVERMSSWIGNRFMFQGREWLNEFGIYDYRHRMYNPGLGRFIQTDPMGLQTEGEKLSAGQKALYSPGGSAPEAFSSSEMNLFRYCGDDPVDGSDPFGLDTVTIEIFKGSPQVVPDQYVERARPGSDAVTLIAPNGGLVTTATTDSVTGEIHVQQRIKTSTWIKQSLADAGEKDGLVTKENKRVEKFKEGLPDAQSKANDLAKKGFGTEAAAKKAVENSTMEVMKQKAKEGQLKWDLTGGRH